MEDLKTIELIHSVESKIQNLVNSLDRLSEKLDGQTSGQAKLEEWQRQHDLYHAREIGKEEGKSGFALSWKQVTGLGTFLTILVSVVSLGLRFLGL